MMAHYRAGRYAGQINLLFGYRVVIYCGIDYFFYAVDLFVKENPEASLA